MPDTRYLKLRKGRWCFQIAVPADLRERVGKKVITKALRTSDTRTAQNARWQHVAAHKELFDRLRQQRPPTAEELKTAAATELHTIYTQMRADPVDGPAGLQGWLHTITGDGESLDLDALRPRAKEIIERIGADPTEESVHAMCGALADAAFTASEYWTRNIEPPALPGNRPNRRQSGVRISEASEQYLTARQRDDGAKMTEQTVSQMRSTFRLFADYTDDAAIASVDRADAAGFLDTIAGLHRHYGRRPGAASLKLRELLQRFPAGNGNGLSNRTVNRHQSVLKTFFRWARRQGKISFNENPFAELSRQKARLSEVTWQPFTADELKKLFKGETFETEPKAHTLASARPWVMAIALYSGMRQAEITELDAEQIKREDGVWFFDITAAKSEAGIRCVPVHPELIRLGLLDYVKAIKRGPLWPGVAPGGPDKQRSHTFAKRFPAFRRGKGVDRDRLVFHSFRKCFVSSLVRANIELDRISLVVGHERKFTGRVYDRDKTPLQALSEIVEAAVYKGLKLRA